MTTWTIGTSDDGDVTAQFVEAPVPSYTRGDEVTLTVGFGTRTAYETIREYGDYAGRVATFTALDGTPLYRELHTDTHDLLLSVRPDTANVPGLWGVLTGFDDATALPGADAAADLSLFMLAEYADHATRSDAETAHER